MANSLFDDLIKIGGRDMKVLDARMKEFSDFSDEQHAAALSRQAEFPQDGRPKLKARRRSSRVKQGSAPTSD